MSFKRLNLLDYAITKTDNEDQDSSKRSFECREQLSKNHSTLNCEEIKEHRQNDDCIRLNEEKRRADILNQPTVVSFVTDALIFRVKHSFFHHAEDDDGPDPELDPQQIPPIAGAPEEPESPEQHVHNAHDHEEL